MKILVLSYSMTGNNEALAASVARELEAEHIKIEEPKPRKTGAIFTDLIFNKTPRVQPKPEIMDNYDLTILAGPVWISEVATPLRAYLKYLKTNTLKFAFISISGGADHDNPKLPANLKKISGRDPLAIVDMHISDLLPHNPKPTRKDTGAYRLNDEDNKKLTAAIVKALKEKI